MTNYLTSTFWAPVTSRIRLALAVIVIMFKVHILSKFEGVLYI